MSANRANGLRLDTKAMGERRRWFHRSANLSYLFAGQDRGMMPFADQSIATFGEHVPVVITGGSEEEMIGSYAPSVIALMQHPQSGRDRTMGDEPRRAMRGDDRMRSAADDAIAFFAEGADPAPAGRWVIGFHDKARKAFREASRLGSTSRTLFGSNSDPSHRVVMAVTMRHTSWRPANFSI